MVGAVCGAGAGFVPLERLGVGLGVHKIFFF